MVAFKDLKVELLCEGARINAEIAARKAGAGPAAGGEHSFSAERLRMSLR